MECSFFDFRVSGPESQSSLLESHNFGILDSGFRFRVSVPETSCRLGFGSCPPPSVLPISRPGKPVSGLRFRISGFGFRASGFGFQVPGFGFRVSGFRFWVSGFGFQVLEFWFRVLVFGFQISGFGLRVSGFGFGVSGFGFQGKGSRGGEAFSVKEKIICIQGCRSFRTDNVISGRVCHDIEFAEGFDNVHANMEHIRQ